MAAVASFPRRENSCVLRGRVLLVRVDAGYRTAAQVAAMEAVMVSELATLPAGERCVVAADWRGVQILSPEATDRIKVMFGSISSKISRSGILTFRETPGGLQAHRLIRESLDGDRRRGFTDPREMLAFLGETASASDLTTLRVFLGL